MTEFLDKAKDIRKGEGLDLKKLEPYLKEQLGLDGELKASQFPSGFSNLTYMLELADRSVVLRRPPFGANIKSAHDMSREFRVLSALNPVYSHAPKPLLYCDDDSVIGAPFYVMERVEGVILRATMPKAMHPTPDLMSGIARSFVQTFADLHSVDYEAAGLADLGKPDGYVERQIKGWTARYEKAQTDELESIRLAANWLADHLPTESAVSLIHNDFKYDNVMLNPKDWTKIIAVLDWEMTTIGDPLMDLGSSLGYWVEATDPPIMQTLGLSPTILPGNPSRAELVSLYEEVSGREVKQPVFYFVYGLFKLAVILQQIYARYKAGHSKDERFAGLIHGVRACGQMAVKAIERDSI